MTVHPSARAPALPAEVPPAPSERAQQALVALAAAQGLLLAAWLGLLPEMVLRVGGFPAAPPFFVRWAGVLHLVLAAGYALEWRATRGVALLVIAKGATALFLLVAWFGGGLPQLLVVAFLVEAASAVGAAALHGPAARSRRARARLRVVGGSLGPSRPAGRATRDARSPASDS